MHRSAILAVTLSLAPLGAHAHAEAGTLVENVVLPTAAGGREPLLKAKTKVTVLVFVRTEQGRSLEALKAMAICERELASKPVRFVAIVSGETPPADARALAAAGGVKMPVLLDEGDALYQKLEVRLHPVVFLLDARNRVAAFEMYRQIDYCDVVRARMRFLLGEIDEAALAAILQPPRNTMPGDDVRDVSRRDVNLGRRQLGIRQYDKALESARKALEKAPSAGAFALIGDVHAARGDCARALPQYEQALKLDPAEEHALAGKAACAAR